MIVRETKLSDAIAFFVAWISISSASVLVLLSKCDAISAAFWRTFIGWVIVLILAFFSDGKVRLAGPSSLLLSSISGLFLALHFLFWMESLFYLPVGVSVTLVVWYPILNALYDKVFLKEKISPDFPTGFVLSFLGVMLMFASAYLELGKNGPHALRGSAYAIMGAVFASLYFFSNRALSLKSEKTFSILTLVYLSSSLFLLLCSFLMGVSVSPGEGSLIFLVLQGVIPMTGGHTLMNYLLRRKSSRAVTMIAVGEPAGASLLAYLIFGQKLSEMQLAGVSLVVLGLVIALRKEV